MCNPWSNFANAILMVEWNSCGNIHRKSIMRQPIAKGFFAYSGDRKMPEIDGWMGGLVLS